MIDQRILRSGSAQEFCNSQDLTGGKTQFSKTPAQNWNHKNPGLKMYPWFIKILVFSLLFLF
jgi:hypothetical protein